MVLATNALALPLETGGDAAHIRSSQKSCRYMFDSIELSIAQVFACAGGLMSVLF